jgi:UPF0755 protein
MKIPKPVVFSILIIGVVLLICLATITAWLGLLELSNQAEARFGSASPSLSFLHRLRLSATLLMNQDNLTEPVDAFGVEQPFEITLGESPTVIARRLEEARLIPDAAAFTDYLVFRGLDTTLQAGQYTLNPQDTPLEIASALQDATPKVITLTVLDGWRIEEIAASLPTSGLEFSPETFLIAAEGRPASYSFLDQLPEGNSLEGFFFPGSYRLPRQSTPDDAISVMLDEFQAQLTPDLVAGFEQQGLDIYEAVILASIVERETVLEDEMPLIASVFLNRLEAEMPLEADSTVQYALGYQEKAGTWWKNPLSLDDLQVDSQFNTYLYGGLPPGPIANPGLTALRAVAFPAQADYYYFRAACDDSGKHHFAETFGQHLQNACP